MLRIVLLTPLLALGLTACEFDLDADLGALADEADALFGDEDCEEEECEEDYGDTGELYDEEDDIMHRILTSDKR